MSDPRLSEIGPEVALLRAVVAQSSAMLAYWDAELRCRFASPAYARWFHADPERIVGTQLVDLLGAAAFHLERPHLEAVLRGVPQEFEHDFAEPAEGASRHSLSRYLPDVVDGRPIGFFVTMTDVTTMKRTQLALREANERFSLTLDHAPIGMALVGLDGRFVRVNLALCEIVGYSAEELTQRTFASITHPDDVDADVAQAARLARGEIAHYRREKRYLHRDGSTVDVLLSVAALRGKDQSFLYFITQVEDITERKRLASSLRLSEARASGILAISADAIICIDEQQRITMFNDGAERIFGYARAEVVGEPLDRLIPERFREVHRRHVESFADGPGQSRLMGQRDATILGLRKNGEEFPAGAALSKLDIDGQRIVTVALRDITEQKRAENEQRFLSDVSLTLATTLDYDETLDRIAALAVRDIADICIIDASEGDGALQHQIVSSRSPERAEACAQLSGIDLDRQRPYLLYAALHGRQPVLMQNPSDGELAALSQSPAHHQALVSLGIRSMVAVPLLARGQTLGAIAFISSTAARTYGPADVRMAEQLAQRAALSIANARLYREAKLATQARDNLLGIVAHDLRNPLHAILVQARLLRRRATQPAGDATRPSEAIERAARRMSRLIEDLLDITRLDAGRLSVETAPISARQVLADAVESQRPLATAAAVELRLEAAPGLGAVLADRDRLQQVFENLIGNALKFTPRGGRITVGAAPHGGEVVFWVADTGKGISADDVPHVFDRFWRSGTSAHRGAGLGLPIVKGIVEAHRGRVWVDSAPGQGSTFSFTMPAAAPAPTWASAPDAVSP